MREIIYSNEYWEYYQKCDSRTQKKLDYLTEIIVSVKVIPKKVAYKLTNSTIYELRVSTTNEHRTMLFAVDNLSLNEAKKVIYLNSFVKKATKDYKKQIKKAEKILAEILKEL
ncbi:MAG: type II toxin-antitoxin system RelE/ParE family toxin [Flavobacteriales bacterium]|nr:type II toxin-antitoxin system RelE/ParE family toxin [Flavobacteriales bacterium]